MVDVVDLGIMDYAEAWDLQHSLFDKMVDIKRGGGKPETEYLLLVEHPPVITLGKHALRQNVLLPKETLLRRGIGVYEIERGGDVTYHGPGQLVAYPIIDLEKHRLGVRGYVEMLEECVIRTIGCFGIKGERIEGASGVWIGKGTQEERKICAVGVKVSRFCTMHGIALNVNTEMDGFRMINPCGFINRGVTSMELELGERINEEFVKEVFIKSFLDLV